MQILTGFLCQTTQSLFPKTLEIALLLHLLTTLLLPQVFQNLLTSGASRIASARAGWAEAHGRVCIGKGNRKCWAVKEQGTHATGSSETKTRTVAGLRVCPAILCLDKGVQNLRLWEQTSGLGSPVLHTQPHCSGGRSPLRAGRAK